MDKCFVAHSFVYRLCAVPSAIRCVFNILQPSKQRTLFLPFTLWLSTTCVSYSLFYDKKNMKISTSTETIFILLLFSWKKSLEDKDSDRLGNDLWGFDSVGRKRNSFLLRNPIIRICSGNPVTKMTSVLKSFLTFKKSSLNDSCIESHGTSWDQSRFWKRFALMSLPSFSYNQFPT